MPQPVSDVMRNHVKNYSTEYYTVHLHGLYWRNEGLDLYPFSRHIVPSPSDLTQVGLRMDQGTP